MILVCRWICETCEEGVIVDNDSDDVATCYADEVVGFKIWMLDNYDGIITD